MRREPAWRTRRARVALERADCEPAVLALLALHVPLLLAVSVLGTGGVAVVAAGLAAVAAACAAGFYAGGRMLRAVALRVGLAAGAAAVIAVTGGPTVAHLPYVAVLALAVLSAPGMLRRYRGDAEQAADEQVVARLDELDQAKNQLLALASHELRTPLTGVMGFARTLTAHLEQLDGDTLRVFAMSIEDHSRRLARLVDNLVATSRGPELELDAYCDLRLVVETVLAELDLPPDADPRIQTSLRGSLDAAISGDAARLVLLNLLDNASKFADRGTLVRLDVRPQGGDLVVDVENVGPPIPADLRERLYEPFIQGDSSDTRKAEGLGLGLHVVRRLVEAHGGRVELLDGNGLVMFRVRLRRVSLTAEAPVETAGAAS